MDKSDLTNRMKEYYEYIPKTKTYEKNAGCNPY